MDFYISLISSRNDLKDIQIPKELSPTNKSSTSQHSPNIPPSLSNYKHLLHYLNKQTPSSFSILLSTILDSKPSKSKYHSDYIPNQQQLYEAMDRTIHDLRNYTQHSLPFLKPVQKREAPNYHEIIFNPMDLSTVYKKLKSLSYSSKLAFCKDLDLIWDNCLLYNTLPDSIYRKHAIAMRLKANTLIKKIPDISLSSEPQNTTNDPQIPLIINTDSLLPNDTSTTTSIMTPTTTATDPLTSSRTPINTLPTIPNNNNETTETADISDPENYDYQDDYHDDDYPDNDNINTETENIYPNDQEDTEDLSMESHYESLWRKNTLQQRSLYYKQRQLEVNKPFPERLALIRTPDLMSEFSNSQSSFLEFVKNSTPSVDESEAQFFSPEIYSPMSCFPFAHIQPLITETPKNLNTYKPAHINHSSKIFQAVLKNIDLVKSLKPLVFKISKNSPNPANVGEIGKLYLPSVPMDLSTKHVQLGKNEIYPLAKKYISLLLLQVGFDSVTETPLAILCELAGNFMVNLAFSIKNGFENVDTKKSENEILIKSLLKNGTGKITDYKDYIERDIFSYGKQLSDIKSRLLKIDYENNLINIKKEDSSCLINEEDELIMSGNFMGALGIDFFNLRDVGLDISQVPLELWNKKCEYPVGNTHRKNLDLEESESTLKKNKMAKLSHWKPIVPEHQIGLLGEHFNRSREDLVEDDFNPNAKLLKSKLLVKSASLGTGKKRIGLGIELNIPRKKSKKGLKMNFPQLIISTLIQEQQQINQMIFSLNHPNHPSSSDYIASFKQYIQQHHQQNSIMHLYHLETYNIHKSIAQHPSRKPTASAFLNPLKQNSQETVDFWVNLLRTNGLIKQSRNIATAFDYNVFYAFSISELEREISRISNILSNDPSTTNDQNQKIIQIKKLNSIFWNYIQNTPEEYKNIAISALFHEEQPHQIEIIFHLHQKLDISIEALLERIIGNHEMYTELKNCENRKGVYNAFLNPNDENSDELVEKYLKSDLVKDKNIERMVYEINKKMFAIANESENRE